MEGRLIQANQITINNNNLWQSSLSLNSLIVRVNYLLKKVELDEHLSCILDEFLEKLQQFNLFISNGIFNTNFTEAALLLQSSSELYCKKVDLLWDIFIDYQKRMVSYGKQNQTNEEEIEKLEQRKRKYKRKSNNDPNQKQTKAITSNFSLNSNEFVDYINQSYEQNDLTTIWNNCIDSNDCIDLNDTDFIENSTLFLPEDILYSVDDNEYIGRYDQFHTSSILSDIFNFINNNEIKIDNNTIDDFLQMDENSNNSYISQENSPENLNVSEKSCFIHLEKLPNDLIEEKLRKSYSFDSGFNQSMLSSSSSSSTSSSPLSLTESSCHQQSFVYLERLPQNLVDDKLKQLKRTKSFSQDSAFFDDFNDTKSLINDNNNNDNSDKDNNNSNVCSRSIIQPKIVKIKTNKLKQRDNDCDNCERPLKRRRISKRLLKLSTGNTVSARSFEAFYLEQYRIAEGEGTPKWLDLLNSKIDNDTDDDNDDHDNFDCSGFYEETVSNRLELSRIDTDHDDVDDFNSPPSTSRFETNETHKESEEISYNNNSIREWKAFILPKLKNLENHSEFDIHEYGTKIIESTNVGETQLFKDIVKEKTSSECARYFLATLQLANTNNIKFNGVQSGRLSNDTLEITVIDKTRYHEFLDDYQAPSEEGFRSKFERIQAMNSSRLHSTPYNESPSKKPRIIKKPQRLQFR